MSNENENELSTRVPPQSSSTSATDEPAAQELPGGAPDSPLGSSTAPRESPQLAELFHVDLGPESDRAPLAQPTLRWGPSSERDAGRSIPTRRRLVRLMLHGVPRVVVVGMLVWGLCFNFSEVRGSSMEPGIHDHDRILVDHVSYLLHEVERGDIVILRYPLDPSVDYIKRIVGLPGDVIVLAGGKLWVNGTLVDEPYVDAAAIDPYTHARIVVEPEHYFVLGDNRMRSSDSREFGQVPRELLRGKVQVRIWPIARLGWIR